MIKQLGIKCLSKLLPFTVLCIYWLGTYWGSFWLARFVNVNSVMSILMFGALFYLIGLLTQNFIYLIIYYFEPECLNKYKITDLEWPWKSDPKKFKNNLPKYLLNYVI